MTNTPAIAKGHPQRHLAESQEHIETAYVCDVDVELNDVVYVGASGVLAQADASDIETCKTIIGVVVEKPGPAECRVKYHGLCFDFTGLVPGKRYWLSDQSPGKLIDTPFDDDDFGVVLKYVGVARDSQTLFLDLSQPPIQH
jgi:hypothetical protein